MASLSTNDVVEAEEVYILLDRDYRVSRNIRLNWFFKHLHSTIKATNFALGPDENDPATDSGVEVLSIIPVDKDHDFKNADASYLISTNTKLTFISSGCRFVFGLDLSASLLRVDTFQHCVVIEAILDNLEECLFSLTQQYTVPGSYNGPLIQPDIYVTVFAQWHGTHSDSHFSQGMERVKQKVLIQGCVLTEASISNIIDVVESKIYSTVRMDEPGRLKSALQKRDDILIGLLRTGLLALRLLPSNTSSGVVILTDGVLGEPDASALERLLSQCQNSTTTCSFIHLNPSAYSLCDFGCISNRELMQFVAKSTKGQYIDTFTLPVTLNSDMNFYQKSLLRWRFQICDENLDFIALPVEKFRNQCSSIELRSIICGPTPDENLITCKQDQRTLRVPLSTVVSSRIREGYEVQSIQTNKNNIEVHLKYLWWKNPTLVEYKASSTWPLSRNPTKVEVFVTSTYQFLHDASKRNQPNNWSLPRRHLLRRFSRYLQDLLQADHMLYHLQSFSHDPVRYTISDVLKQGQSLFYLPSNSPEFVLSTQAEHVPSVFTSYWKPILSLDVSIWQKWLHIHRIELILKHDSPLPKFASAGQYNSVQSCVAFTQLTMMLRKWCSFVLMENHTYVRFVFEEDNIETPASFFLVRLSSKSPALVLKLAFQFGVSGQIRKKLVTDLQEQVSNLGTPSSSSTKRSRHPTSRSPGSKSQRSHFSSAENCSVLMHKPVDQILVRHQHLPRDYLKVTPVFDSQQRPHEHAIRMRDVQWYLRHKRYVWSLTNTVATPLLMDVAESLSKLLVKLRLAEGYHIAHSTSGIVNLTREFPMISSSCERSRSVDVNNFCLVQYVLFPAVVRSSETSLSGEDSEDELEETNNTKEIILAVEIWVEPQDGFIRQSSNKSFASSGGRTHSASTASSSSFHQESIFPSRDALPYYENLTYKEVAKAIIQNDTMCISNIVTLEHFQLMCTNPEISSTLPQASCLANWPSNLEPDKNKTKETGLTYRIPVEHIDNEIAYFPCLFNTVALMEKSSRVKMLFMTLGQDKCQKTGPNNAFFSNFHSRLETLCDCEISLTTEDQVDINDHMMRRNPETDKVSTIEDPSVQWRCYLKKGENGQVFVILLPASYEAFLQLFARSKEEQENCSTSSSANTLMDGSTTDISIPEPSPSTTQVNYSEAGSLFRAARRISVKRLSSMQQDDTDITNQPLLKNQTLPVYVYNCSMQILVTTSLQGVHLPQDLKWPDSVQDHRFKPTDTPGDMGLTYSLSPSKDFDVIKSFPLSPDTNDDVFSLNSSENDYLNAICNNILDLYSNSFVVGLFSAVKDPDNVAISMDDLNIATDLICTEYVDEIDITDFVLLNCPQVVEFKNTQANLKSVPDSLNPASCDIEDLCMDTADKQPKELTQSELRSDLKETVVHLSEKNKGIILNPKPDNLGGDPDLVNEMPRPDPAAINKNITSSERRSAFHSVQRQSRRTRASENEPNMAKGSTSTDEESDQKSNQSRKYKGRKIDRHLPTVIVKKMAAKSASPVPFGWDNLPAFPVSLLQTAHSRHISGTNDQVEKQFQTLLSQYCASVSGVPDLYYAKRSSVTPFLSTEEPTPSGHIDSDFDTVHFDSSNDYVQANTANSPPVYKINEQIAEMMIPASSYDGDTDSSESENESPLFLYMTCSVKDKSTGNHGFAPVHHLPVQLQEIINSFENPCEEINLSELKVTLDLIWIFLPKDVSEELSGTSPVPPDRLHCVEGTKETINWLLEDEIISSLRTCEPMNKTTIDRVVQHIEKSKSNNCRVTSEPLNFIFGAEKSKSLFAVEFERKKLRNYKLRKESDFYYLQRLPQLPNFTSSCCQVINDSTAFNKQEIPYSSIEIRTDSPKQEPSFHENPAFSNNFYFQPAPPMQNASSSLSLMAIEADVYPAMKLINPANAWKSSSTTDVTCSSLSSRRSSSVSMLRGTENLPKPTAKTRPSPLLRAAASDHSLRGNSQLSSGHPLLNISLSTGATKETSFSPLRSGNGATSSMPVTPLGLHTKQPRFYFPSDKHRSDSNYPPDVTISPISDSSPRHFSQTSWLGSGYDGEVSESENDDDSYHTLQEAYTQLPNFWLIIQIKDDCANVFFHRRNSTKVLTTVKAEHARMFVAIVENARSACRAINQILLLKELHDTHISRSLLIENPVEDIWKNPSYNHSSIADESVLGDSTTDAGDYLAASMSVPPGHFECACVYQQTIILHHRIAEPSSSSSSHALSTARSAFKNFSIVNQKNMYVFQLADETVYYCRIQEEGRRNETPSGRRSSLLPSSSECELPSIIRKHDSKKNLSQDSEPKLCLCWYGVHRPDSEQTNALEKLKQTVVKRLDEAVVDKITLMLSRNPMFKLTPADVKLIQPRVMNDDGILCPVSPDKTLRFTIPQGFTTGKDVSTLLYYIHQNLQQFLTIPRYTEPILPQGHFLPFCVTSSEPTVPSSIYLFNAYTEKVRKWDGIACVFFDILNTSTGAGITLDEVDNASALDRAINVENVAEVSESVQAPILNFYLWIRGSINCEGLQTKIKMAIRNGLVDFLIEKLLTAPLSSQPIAKKTEAMRTLTFSADPATETQSIGKSNPSVQEIPRNPQSIDAETLSPVYSKFLLCWLNHIKSLSIPSVYYKQLDFKCHLCCNEILNIAKIVRSVVSDSSVMLYLKSQSSESFLRIPDENEAAKHRVLPGQTYQCVIITRNLDLWNKSAGLSADTAGVISKSVQKYSPHDSSVKPDKSPCPQHELITASSYIPRQHFVLQTLSNNKLETWCYNLTNEKAEFLSKQLGKCSEFHNARFQLMENVTLQKLGLFHGGNNAKPKDGYSVEMLTHYKHFPIASGEKKYRSAYVERYFDNIYLNNQPVEALMLSEHAEKDKVKLYGQQALAMIKKKVKTNEEKRLLLVNMYSSICRSPLSLQTICISTLNVVLQFSRVIRQVYSPMLCTQAVQNQYDSVLTHKSPDKSEKLAKSQSMLTMKQSFLGSYRRKSGDSVNKTNLDKTENLDMEKAFRDTWNDFVSEFSKQWSGFAALNVAEPVGNQTKFAAKLSISFDELKNTYFMYRAIPCGVLIASLALGEHNFIVKLYALDISQLPEQETLKQRKLSVDSFINECEKFKENIDGHIFALTFHIHCIRHILRDPMQKYKYCDIVSVLHSMICYFQPLLSDLDSYMMLDYAEIHCHPSCVGMFYEFLVRTIGHFCFNSYPINKGNEDIKVLFTMLPLKDAHTESCASSAHDGKNTCVIISPTIAASNDAIRLQYFILVSEKPKPQTPEPQHRPLQPGARRFSETTDAAIFTKATKIQSKQYTKTTDLSIEKHFSECEKLRTKCGLEKIGLFVSKECYRQTLWQKLISASVDKTHDQISSMELDELLRMMQVNEVSKYDPDVMAKLCKIKPVKRGTNLQKRIVKKYSKQTLSVTSKDSSTTRVCMISSHVMVIIVVKNGVHNYEILTAQPNAEVLPLLPHATSDIHTEVSGTIQQLLKLVLQEAHFDICLSWT